MIASPGGSGGPRPGAPGRERPPGAPARAGDDPLRRAARRRPGAVALAWPGGRWSYGELDGRADALARVLAGRGAGAGTIVASLLPDPRAAATAIHAVPRTAAALAPLHPGWTGRELAAYAERIAPSLLLCRPAEEERARASAPAGCRVVALELPPPGEGDGGGRALPGPRPGSDHTVVATSGSGGPPRGVRLTLGNHLACARAAIRRLGLGAGDRWLASLPLAHVGGIAMVVRAAVSGARLVVREGFEAERLLRLAARGEVTHASLVPVMLRRLVEEAEGREEGDGAGRLGSEGPGPLVASGREEPPGLRCLLVGGDAADPALVERAHGLGLPVALTYGLTEASSQVATAPPDRARQKPGSVGRPLEGVDVRIDEGGEILVRGPTVMAGYVGRGEPAAPAGSAPGPGDVERAEPAFGPDGGPGLDAEGWLRTGDAGRFDDDGDLHVLGRLGERIVTGGVTVGPAEVESVLRSHPAVRDAVVVGLPDAEWGERVAAAVEVDATAGVSEEELDAFCRERLSSPRRPRAFLLVGSLPRNPTGKPDRQGARRMLETGA